MTTRRAIVLVPMIFTAATRLNTPGPAIALYKESPIVTAMNKLVIQNTVIIFFFFTVYYKESTKEQEINTTLFFHFSIGILLTYLMLFPILFPRNGFYRSIDLFRNDEPIRNDED